MKRQAAEAVAAMSESEKDALAAVVLHVVREVVESTKRESTQIRLSPKAERIARGQW